MQKRINCSKLPILISILIVLTLQPEAAALADKLKYEGRCRSDDECNWSKNHHCRDPSPEEIANAGRPPPQPVANPPAPVANPPVPANNNATPNARSNTRVGRAAPGNGTSVGEPPPVAPGPAATVAPGPAPVGPTSGPAPATTTMGPLPDDGKVVAGVQRCLCLKDTKPEVNTGKEDGKPDSNCDSIFAYLNDACGDIAVTKPGQPKVCAAHGNLQCEDIVPTQFSTCRCIGDSEPNIYSRVCQFPPNAIKLGEPCNVNATAEEEFCDGEYSICSEGFCVCDVEDPAILKDEHLGDCYLRIEARNAKHNSATRLAPFKVRSLIWNLPEYFFQACIIVCLMCLVNMVMINEFIDMVIALVEQYERSL